VGMAVSYAVSERITVEVPEGAFDQPTLVTVTELDVDDVGVAPPTGLAIGAYIDVDFEGEANETLRLKVRAPEGINPTAQVFIGEPTNYPWGKRIRMLSVGGVLVEGVDDKFLSNDPSLQPEPEPAGNLKDFGQGTWNCQDALEEGLPQCFLQSLLYEFAHRSTAAFFYEQGAEWTVMAFGLTNFPMSVGFSNSVFYNFLADIFVYVPVAHDWSGHVVLPVLEDSRFQLIERDAATGWIINEHDEIFVPENPEALFQHVELDARNLERPLLVGAYPFDFLRFNPDPGERQELRLELAIETTENGTFTIVENETFPLSDGTGITLLDMDPNGNMNPDSGDWNGPYPQIDPVHLCSFDGLDDQHDAEREHLLIVGSGDLDPNSIDAFRFQFDRGLDPGFSGFEPEEAAVLYDLGSIHDCNQDLSGSPTIPLEVTLSNSNSQIVLTPVGKLPAGHSFVIELQAEAISPPGNNTAYSYANWTPPLVRFPFSTRPVPGDDLTDMMADSIVNTTDLMQFGNLTMVATRSGEIYAVDSTNTTELVPADGVTPEHLAPGQYTVHAEYSGGSDHIRAFATDGHNRLFFNARVFSAWTLKAIAIEDVRNAEDGVFEPVQGYVKTAYSLGAGPPVSASEWLALGAMPSGTPADLEIVVQDEVGDALDLYEFAERYEASLGDPDDEGLMSVSLTLESTNTSIERTSYCQEECPYDRFQRVTIKNLTTGQSWSQDIENEWNPDDDCPVSGPGSSEFEVTARAGDRLQVRHNITTLGYVAIVGSGITVVDLNRMYRVPLTNSPTWGPSQCYRRLGQYQGQDINFPSCANGLRNGIDMTPAVAVLGDENACPPPPDEPRRSDIFKVNTYSPLTHVNLVHSVAQCGQPGDLSLKEEISGCLKAIKTGVVFDHDEGQDVWVKAPVSLRDVAVARGNTWIDRGITGTPDGIFETTETPTQPEKTVDLLFASLGDAGIYVYDVSSGDLEFNLVGNLRIDGHSIHRLQVDENRNLLFAGGYGPSKPVIQIWDISSVNGAPNITCGPDVLYCPEGTDTSPRPLVVLHDVPWTTNHLALDETGTGLLRTIRGGSVVAVPFSSPQLQFIGLFAPEEGAVGPLDDPQPASRAIQSVVPLGVPMEVSLEEEENQRAENDRASSAVVKLRVALPGSVGHEVTAKIQSLRVLPDRKFIGQEDLGLAVADFAGDLGPSSEVVVTLRRIGLGDDEQGLDLGDLSGETGPLSNAYDLYESLEKVVLISDPRAWTGYDRQDVTDDGANGSEHTRIADEEGQCRRCSWPDFLPDPDTQDPEEADELRRVKELVVTGPYLRAFLFVPEDCDGTQVDRDDPEFALCGNVTRDGLDNTAMVIDFLDTQGANYRKPGGAVEVAAWLDDVPSPIQVSLAEPALNPSIWSTGEAGVAVSLVSGEGMLSAADHSVPGRSLSFLMSRTYRSGFLGTGPLGPGGWTGRLFAHLREIPTTGEVEYHDGAGHVWRYYPDPGLGDDDCQGVGGFYAVPGAYDVCNPVTGYIAPKGLFLDLTRTPTGGWRLVGRHRESMVFDPDGRLVEFRDRHRGGEPDPDEQGSTMYLTHDIYGQLVHVEDDLGRRYRLTYYDDPQNSDYGLLKSVTDFGDREIEYAYDDEARLQNVRLPEVTIGAGEFVADGFPFEGDADDRPTLTYSYYDAGASGGIPENADDAILHGRFAKFRIEGFTLPEFPTGQGQVADGLRVRLTYQPISGRVAKMGFPLGDEFSEWSVDEIDPPNNAAPSSAAAVTAPWEHERNYTIEKGRTKVIEEQLQVRAGDGTISSPDLTTRFDYEDDGRLKEQLRPDGSAQTIEYEPDPYSRREVANPRFITITAGGTPLPHDPPRTGINFNEDNIPNNVIDAVQRQIGLAVPTVPSAEEQLEKTIFHPFGPTETGVSRSYKFDTFGRAVEIFGGEQQAKSGGGEGPKLNLSYGFDAKGRANAGLVESATQGNGLKQSFEYDQFDNLNKVQDETFGKQSQAITDEWGRPVSVASGQAKSGSLLAPVGSGPCSGSPWLENGGMLTDRAFDAAGHLVRERSCQDYIDAAGEIDQRWVETRYHYNRREQLVRIEKNNLAAPGLAGQWNPGFHDILLLGYDEKGRLKTQTVPNQETEPLVTTFNYDPAGRMDGVFVGNGAVRVQGYDVNGRVNYRSDGDAGTWFAEYDALDRVFREYLPTGARVERQFDAAGNVLNERVFDSADGRMLSRTATYFTSFGLADMTIDFLAESPDSGDDLRITKRFFDASGRTSAVVSGPVLDLGGLNDIFTLQLDPDKDRLEMEILYEPLSNRPIDRFYGGCYDPQHPDNCAAEYQEHMIYKAPDIAVPWPDQIDVFERVPSQSTLVLTGSTEFVRDVQGRPLEVKSSDGSLLITTYDRMGGAIRTQTGAGTVNLSIFDGGGLLLRRLRPSPRGSTAYAYDVDGRKLAQITQNEAGDPLWSTVFHYDSTNNTRGLVSQIDHPDGSNETFLYNPDDTVYQWTNRDLLTLGYTYDAANRPRRVEPDGTPPTSMIPLDDGDFKEFDALSRIDIVDRAPFDGPSTPFKVDYSDYDLGGRPTEETVGERPPLAWSYDVFDRPTNVTLPEGVGRDAGDPFTGYERSWDTLDRLTGVGGVDTGGGVIPDIGADWVWGGAGRLYGITSRGPLATAVRYGYIGIAGPELPPGSPEGSLGKLGTLTYGAGDAGPTSVPTHTWGAFGYGWRGAGVDGERQDGMKIGRKVLTDGAGLLASMGWSWHLDNGLRLEDAHAGLGSLNENDSTGSFETFGFKYREGDQLEWMSRTTGELVQYEHSPAPYGRIEARDDVAYGYDRSGRRTTDDRFSYRWDWRGRLYEVTILEDAGTLFDGHQVRYEYDALGRLFHRVHLGEDPGDGNRPFIEYRAYLWEGNGLLAEAGYGSHDGTWDDPDTDLFLRWRKSYVPGASGLDDAVQVRVQTVLPEATDNVYSYLRDELGTVLGLVEEVAGADPEAPPLLVRYLYTPYGEVHAESGPELRAVVFDNDVTEVVTTTGTVTQTIENPASHAQGVLELTLSLPADEAALAAGLTLTDAETETTLAQGVGYVIGRPEDDPATLQILPLAGWERSHDYRVELKTDLVDSVGRALVHERSFVWDIPAAGAVGSPPQPDLTPSYDSIVAASSDLGGAFPGGQTALFQGLWTDPVTGIAYARNRWYDARTASWLSEDPMGAVDSPNLYAFVGWGPHMYTDPYGYWSWDPASGYRWVQARVGEAKDFYSSSDSVALDAVGNTLSDLGGGIGSVLNIGTNTGETYVEEGGFHDLESTALITAAGLGDLSETILAATGAASTAVKTAQTVRQVQQLRRIKRELQAATSSEQTGELLAQRELVRRGFDIGPDVKIRGKQGEGAGNQGVDLVFERKNVISPDKSITVESKSVNFPELKNDTRQIQQATDEFNRTRLDRAADPRLSSPDTIREATRLQELREANRLKSYKSVYDPVSGTVKFYEVVSDESGTQVLEEVTTRLLSTGF